MRYFIIILAFLFSLKIQSQSKCVCCAYHIIEFNDNFDDLFKSDLIKKQKIKTAIIYTTENYDTIKQHFMSVYNGNN